MDIRFYLDPDTGLPHIYGHGVTEADVERVLCRPGEDGPSSGGSRQAVGQAEGGRAWFKNPRFRVTHGISARTLIGPGVQHAMQRVVRAGLRESLVAVLGLQFRENRVYPRSSSQ